MPDVTPVLSAFAALALLVGVAWTSFRIGKAWGRWSDSIDGLAAIWPTGDIGNPAAESTDWEDFLRDEVTSTVAGLVADGVHTDDVADALRGIADELETGDAGGDAGR